MADLPEKEEWTPGIYQLETSDPVLGGPDGIDNLQGKQLANRTRYLFGQLEKIFSGAAKVGKAGIADTLIDNGVVPGTYPKVMVNTKGLVYGSAALKAADIPALPWSKIQDGIPTTLGGYGITDALKVGVVSFQVPVLAAPTAGDTYEDVALVVREAGGVGATQSDARYAPSISFYWYGRIAGKLFMDSAGSLTWRGQRLIDTRDLDAINTAVAGKAPAVNPTFTGLVNVPTAPVGSNNALAANTQFVTRAISDLIKQAPSALDTLAELAAAMGNDPNFATTVTNMLANKADKATTLSGYGITDALKVGGVSRQQPVLSAPTVGETLSDAAFVIRETQEVAEAQSTDAYAPGFSFYWKGRTAAKLIMDAVGVLKWGGKPVLTGKFATFDELNEGASDGTVVSPFKLRWGFSFLTGGTGYIQFPPWLGGFLVQWGIASGVPKASTAVGAAGPTRDVTLPISFTADVFRVFATMNFATMAATATGAASSAGTPGAIAISRSVIRVQNNYSGSDGEISWLAIGR